MEIIKLYNVGIPLGFVGVYVKKMEQRYLDQELTSLINQDVKP